MAFCSFCFLPVSQIDLCQRLCSGKCISFLSSRSSLPLDSLLLGLPP